MNSLRRMVCSSLAACTLAACSHPPQGGDPVLPGPFAGVHLASNDLWSGGEASIISPSFKSLLALPTVQVGGTAVAVRRVEDSTIAAQLPDADAVLALHMATDSFLPFDASITVHGFQQIRIGPIMPGAVQPLPGQASVIGAGAIGLIEVDLRTNTITHQFPDTVHSIDCSGSVGQSVVPGHFTFWGKVPGVGEGSAGCANPAAWQYGATPTRTSWLPATVIHGNAVAEIGVAGSITSAKNFFITYACASPPCTPTVFAQSLTAFGITIGATSRRAVMHSVSHLVVNTQTGDTLFRLPFASNLQVLGAAFSPGEDTMYVIAGNSLITANSATGSVYRNVTVSDGFAWGILRDDKHPWIYVLTNWTSGRAPEITVLDRITLTTIAVVRAPTAAILPSNDGWDTFRLVRDPSANRLFVVATIQEPASHTQTSRILSYGVPTP